MVAGSHWVFMVNKSGLHHPWWWLGLLPEVTLITSVCCMQVPSSSSFFSFCRANVDVSGRAIGAAPCVGGGANVEGGGPYRTGGESHDL
jgi:hypothetical protein